MPAGSIVVDLLLRSGSFSSDLDRDRKKLQAFGKAIDKEIAGAIKTASVAAVGLVAVTGAVAAAFQTLTKGAADYQDFAEMIGGSAEEVASLAVAAATAGVSMDSVVSAANRLTKGMTGVDEESSKVRAGLKALNINIEDFKKLSAVEQYEAVGKALGGFAESADKSAIAQAILSKAGAENLKVFAALQEQGGRQVILTQAQIEAADKYADAQAKAGASLKLMAQAAATQALPALSDLAAVAVDVAKELLGIDKVSGQMAADNGVRKFAEAAADALAFAADQVDLFTRLFQIAGKTVAGYTAIVTSFATGGLSAARAAGKAAEEDVERVLTRITAAERLAAQRNTSAIRNIQADPRELARRGRPQTASEDSRPKLPRFTGPPDQSAAKQALQLLKKDLDGQLQAIKDFGEQQRDAFAYANALVRNEYETGTRSLEQTFAVQQTLRDNETRAQLANFDKQVAALQAFRDKTGKGTPERVDAENKIADALRERASIETKAGRDATLALTENRSAAKALQQQYEDLRATVAELAGDTRTAANIRIGRQVADAGITADRAGQGQDVVQQLERQLRAQFELSEAQRQYGLLVDRARMAEENAYLAAQERGAGELATLAALGQSRQRSLVDLGEMVKKANELAVASGGNPEAIKFADELALAYRRAALEIDPLTKKMDALLADSFTDAFVGFIEGTMSAKDAFKSFANDVISQLIRMSAQQAALNLFSSSGGGTAGGTAAGGGGGWTNAIGGLLAGLFGGGRAGGGYVGPNRIHPIGERGAEIYDDGRNKYLITAAGTGRVDATPQMPGRRQQTNNISINVPGSTDRKTARQVGAEVARQISAVNSRYN